MKSKNFNETHSPKYNQPSHIPPSPQIHPKKGKLDLLIAKKCFKTQSEDGFSAENILGQKKTQNSTKRLNNSPSFQ
jgi:hypothetical protein